MVLIGVTEIILKNHRHATIITYFLYLQRIPMPHTKIRKFKPTTLITVADRTKKTMIAAIKKVFNIYNRRGLEVIMLIADLV